MNAMLDIPPYPADAGVSTTITTMPVVMEGQRIRVKITRTIETRVSPTNKSPRRVRRWMTASKDMVGIAMLSLGGLVCTLVL